MKKIILAIVALFLVGVGTGLYFYFQGTTDYSNQTPDVVISQEEILRTVDSDTTKLASMRNKLVLIQAGIVKNIQHDNQLSVIELAASDGGSSIVCQIDPRHNEDIKPIQIGTSVNLKGILTDFTLDTDLGLGNTIQLNYCVIDHSSKK